MTDYKFGSEIMRFGGNNPFEKKKYVGVYYARLFKLKTQTYFCANALKF